MPADPQQVKMATAMYSSPFSCLDGSLVDRLLVFLLYIRRYFFLRSEGPAVQTPVDLQ